MKKIHINRLRKLIAFLRKLPVEKFNFATEFEKRPRQKCPTVGCAIGWTPAVFPKLVQWTTQSGSFQCGASRLWYANVAEKLFGLPVLIAADLFFPDSQDHVDARLPNCGSDATPKQVADMLEKFLELQNSPQ